MSADHLHAVGASVPQSTGSVLVTGATGFLGRHVLEALLQHEPGTRALALVRRKADWLRQDWAGGLPNVTPLEGSVTGPESWTRDRRLEGLRGIYHLAAVVKHSRRDTAELYETNVEGTLRMVRLAAQHKCRLVFVSTSGTVGCFRSPDRTADEDAPYCDTTVAGWPYYDSKVKAERKARALASELGVDLVILRPPILLGPGDHRFRSTGNILKYLTGRLPFLLDGGMAFTDIRDVAPAVLAAMHHPSARPVYHLPGTACTVEQFFELCRQVSGVVPPHRKLPYKAAWGLASAAEQLAHQLGQHSPLPDPVVVEMAACYWGLTTRYAGPELGFSPRPARQTLADTIAWLRLHHPALKGTSTLVQKSA